MMVGVFLGEVLCKIILTDPSVQQHAQNGQDGSTGQIKENYYHLKAEKESPRANGMESRT